MKIKILSPIIYTTFILPMTAIMMGAVELIARAYNLVPNYYDVFSFPYLFPVIGILLAIGIPIYLVGNLVISKIEKKSSFSKRDHLRQSAGYYLLISLIILYWLLVGPDRGENDVYFLTWLGISFTAISINLIYSGDKLFKKLLRN